MMSVDITPEVSRLFASRDHEKGFRATAAKALGVTTQTVGNWMAGKIEPKPDKWPGLEALFSLNAGHFQAIADGRVPPTTGRSAPDDDVEERIDALTGTLRGVLQELERLRSAVRTVQSSPKRASPRPRSAAPAESPHRS